MREFLDRIDSDDEEHGAAWLTDEAGRTLEWNGNGVLVFVRARDRERGGSVHLTNVSREAALEFWIWLTEGRMEEINAAAWRPGPRPPMSAAERADRERRYAAHRLESDRTFYEALGSERQDVPCRRADCNRGAIKQSVLCRRHHFESIQQRPCPFDD